MQNWLDMTSHENPLLAGGLLLSVHKNSFLEFETSSIKYTEYLLYLRLLPGQTTFTNSFDGLTSLSSSVHTLRVHNMHAAANLN